MSGPTSNAGMNADKNMRDHPVRGEPVEPHTPPQNRPSTGSGQAKRVLALLFSINILNYVDRQILYAVLPLIKSDLLLTDTQLGMLASAFMLVYMTTAPLVAVLSDRTSRRAWIGGGALAWSAATSLTGFSSGYAQLFASRSIVGIGESSYGSISPSFVAEYFPARYEARALAIFSMAIPVGSALGYVFGGFVGHRFGWRHAFIWAGLAGAPLGIIALFLKDPRGKPSPLSSLSLTPNSSPESGEGSIHQRVRGKPSLQDYLALFKNRIFLLDTLAMAASTFALGGFAVWMPTFFHRQWGMNVERAGTVFGSLTVVSGLAGTLTGGWIADRLLTRTKKAYFLVSGVGLAMSLPFAALALASHQLPIALAALGTAEFLVFLNTGPLNAVIISTTPLATRTMAFAVNIFFIHALGDAISPTLIGYVSDLAGLKTGLCGATAFLALAAAFCFRGMKQYETTPGVQRSRGPRR
jgi:MFS family permease